MLVFGYGLEVAAGVGLALAQVGEFVFVLLSLAHGQELLATQVYLLLMGEPGGWCKGGRVGVFMGVRRCMQGRGGHSGPYHWSRALHGMRRGLGCMGVAGGIP